MASEQGAGHGIESNRRHMSTASTSEQEQITDPEPKTNTMPPTQPQQQESQFQQSKQVFLRTICNKPPNPPSQAPLPTTVSVSMSGITPGATASTASTPTPQHERDYFTARRGRPIVDPPVTKATLSELDVANIIANPRLRHDINFDPELHFRPNIDGNKGRRKGIKAERFWSTLHDQLILFVLNRDEFYAMYGTNDDWCLPQLLTTVKDIIQTLVPARDRAYLEEGLNVPLLMQQFNKGIADLEKLASWLSSVLKSHCAPMRDEWVDRMYQRLSNGNKNNDMSELVQGMRNLLEVLEAMKLDVANHQIRCLRAVLIEDTVHFEKRFVLSKAGPQRKVDVESSRQWFSEAQQRYARTVSPLAVHAFGDMAVFFEALSRLILPSVPDAEVPSSLLLHDQDRLAKLRSDALDAVNLDVCMRLYDDLERVSRSVNSFFSNGFPTQYTEEEPAISRTASPFGFDFNTRPSSGSRPSSLAISCSDSATSSPRSSMVLPTQVTSSPESTEAKIKARNLYNSLLALLQTAPPVSRNESRWAALAPSLALQIFRFTNAPSDMLPTFEAKLLEHVTSVHGSLYREVEEQFHNRLFTEIQRRVRDLRALTALELFTVATGGRGNAAARTQDACRDTESRETYDSSGRETREESGIKDMALRVAHMGILHWRVFADIAYVGDGSNMGQGMPAPGEVHC